MPWLRAVARIVGKRCSQNLLQPEVPGVEPHVRLALLAHPPGDRLGDHVAGRQVGELVLALHEPVALEVDEERALAADRLGDQRLLARRLRAQVHHRRVELDELEVAQHRAGAQRERHPVAGGHRRVGGRGEHLAEAAGGEHHGAAAHRADAVALTLAHHVQGEPGDGAVGVELQVEHQRVLDHLDVRARPRSPRPAPAGSPHRWRRRRRARSGRGGGRPRGSARARRPRRGRSSRRVAISSRTASGPSVTSTRTASRSQAPAPATRVSGSCSAGAVAGSERCGDAALGPLGRAGGEHVLGDHQDLARPGRAAAAPRSGRRCRCRRRRRRRPSSSRARPAARRLQEREGSSVETNGSAETRSPRSRPLPPGRLGRVAAQCRRSCSAASTNTTCGS